MLDKIDFAARPFVELEDNSDSHWFPFLIEVSPSEVLITVGLHLLIVAQLAFGVESLMEIMPDMCFLQLVMNAFVFMHGMIVEMEIITILGLFFHLE